MSRFIPVGPEKWAAMVKAQADLPRWKEMCDELDARCNELKSEVERLNALIISGGAIVPDAKPVEDIEAENARLKAEIEELRLENGAFKRTVNQASVHYDNRLADIARLKAEVEALKRAGDLMLKFACANMPYPPYVTLAKDWNAAKDGKPSA